MNNKILKAGDCFHLPPGFVHQEEALTDCEIIEISTPHFNDRVRVEKNMELNVKKAFQQQTILEIIEK